MRGWHLCGSTGAGPGHAKMSPGNRSLCRSAVPHVNDQTDATRAETESRAPETHVHTQETHTHTQETHFYRHLYASALAPLKKRVALVCPQTLPVCRAKTRD